MELTLIVVMVVGATLAVGGVSAGLLVGYWRGRNRGISLAANERISPELDILAGVGNAILSAQLKVDALCEVIYQQATRIVPTANFQIGLFDNKDYLIKIWLKDAERLPSQRFEGKADDGIIGWVRKSGTGLLVHDFEAEWETLPARPSQHTGRPSRSAVFAPLITGGTALGVIAVQSDRANAFSDEEMRLLTLLANLASGAIRNAQTLEATQEMTRQLRLINDVTRQVTAMQPPSNLFRQIVTLIHDAFGYYAVNIFICDEPSNTIQLKASSHEQFARAELVVKPDQGIVGWAAANHKTTISPNVSEDERYLPSAMLEATRSEIAVPLIVQDRVMGVLDVQSNRLDAFGSDDSFMLETLAGQLALAVQEAETYHAERRQTERINAMTEVARALVSILDIDDLLDEVIDLVNEYLGYDRVHLFLRVGDRLVFRSGSGVYSGRWALEKLSYDINAPIGIIPRVARSGQSALSRDVTEDPDYRVGPGVEDTRSEMTVPIRVGARILGVFDIQSTQINAFSSDDLVLVQALADTVAIALRNATLFANESRRRILSETLRELSTVLGSSLDLNRVLEGIMVGLERVVPYTSGLILLLEKEDQIYQIETARGDFVEQDADVWSETIPLAEANNERLINLLHRLNAAPDQGEEPHDEILVQLTIAGDPIGYLVIERIGQDRFTPEDKEIITTFANQAAVAITNAQLYMAQREEAWISTALLQVAEATARATDLDEVLSTVVRITPLLVGVEWSAVLLADQPDTYRVVQVAGISSTAAAAMRNFVITPLNWPPIARLRQDGQPILLDANTAQPANMPLDINVAQGVILPLYAKGEIMGLLVIGQRDGAEPMTDRKIELVSGIANQAALAIESAQLVTAQQEEAWVTTALLQVAESVNTQIDPDQSLETIVRLTPMLVGVERCGIMKWAADSHRFVGGPSWGLPPEKKAVFSTIAFGEEDKYFLTQLIDCNEAIACGIGTDYPLPPILNQVFETPTLLGLPLIARGHLVGAMLVDHPILGGQMDQRRLNILNGIAHQTAMTLENARLQSEATAAEGMERELDVARGIQASFLPDKMPTIEGWDVGASYRAARQVGGDFYDFFPVDDHRWALVIADVADKGVPAALFMALSRTLLRAVGSNRQSPAETLSRVNQLLLRDTRSDLFVTVWYGLWDTTSGEIKFASAGHNPPLVVRADGSVEILNSRGIALGVVPQIRVQENEITLGPGDLLLAYTDGATEALRSDETEFGVIGLQSTVVSHRRKPAQEIAQGVVRAIDTFVGSMAQFDDITLFVIKHLPESPDDKKRRVANYSRE
ncbi:MAG: GAF domain-containing protein [Chloroflexi bacterium]|nr:GAF domain-containing protein [Chloroflexota bacterium]